MYTKASEYLEASKNENLSLCELALKEEIADSGKTAEDIDKELSNILTVMRESCSTALKKGCNTIGGMIGGDSKKAWEYSKKALSGDTIEKAMARALSCSEVNASMGRICAAPTAGSCGILPAALITIGEKLESNDTEIKNALLTSSAIGAIIARNASVSGAEGGCQAECGAASAMAAAAIVEMAGGSPEMSMSAAAISLQNIMGLICDPIAGLVESPCSYRNSSGVVNAITSADLALSGIKSVIPLDEVIEAMYVVGRQLPTDLRETGHGGVARTPTGEQIRERVFGKKDI